MLSKLSYSSIWRNSDVKEAAGRVAPHSPVRAVLRSWNTGLVSNERSLVVQGTLLHQGHLEAPRGHWGRSLLPWEGRAVCPPSQTSHWSCHHAAMTAHTEHSAWVRWAAVKEGSKGHAVGDVSLSAHCLALYTILDNATGCGFLRAHRSPPSSAH